MQIFDLRYCHEPKGSSGSTRREDVTAPLLLGHSVDTREGEKAPRTSIGRTRGHKGKGEPGVSTETSLRPSLSNLGSGGRIRHHTMVPETQHRVGRHGRRHRPL